MRQQHSFYPVLGVSPVKPPLENVDQYLYVATSLPSGPPSIVQFLTSPCMQLRPGSVAHSKVFVPVVNGIPQSSKIQIAGLKPSLSLKEVDGLRRFTDQEDILWTYDCTSSQVSVFSSTHNVPCITPRQEVVIFSDVSSQAIVLAGLRAFAEQRC